MSSVGTRLRERLNTVPYKYQIQGVRFAEINNGCCLIADDMGLGKTLQALGYVAIHPEARPVICVVPAPMKYGWQRQFRKHADIKSEVLEGRTPYRPRRSVLIINYEILESWVDALLKLNPKVVIIDECHYIKNRTAKRTKALKRLASKCRHRIALSGTPITNSPVEFFPTLQIIKPKLFSSFHEYAWTFCDPRKGFRGHLDYRGSSNPKKLHKLVSPFMIRRLQREVLKDLPIKRQIVVPVDISNEREYSKARDDFVAWLEMQEGADAVQSASGALTLVRLGKLKQLAALGKLKTAIQWIQDFLEETDQKLVVFAIHKPVLEALRKKFPQAAFVWGKTKLKERARQVDRFRLKKCRLFLGQIKVAGTGINGLQVANTTLTLELGWNQSIHNQAEGRTSRIGQKSKSCTNYYLIARNTVEEWLLEVIQEKQINVDRVLEGRTAKGQKSLLKMLERFE